MTKITIYRNDLKRIVRVHIEGHALFRRKGEDIVCAAVSVLAVTAINSCEKLLGVEVPAQAESGWLDCSIPQDVAENVQHDMQLLFESMVFGLQDVSDQYPNHVLVINRTIQLNSAQVGGETND